ncbi:MAG: exo-alpha-sialidase [Myxococcales bacterium]|nr:exo-alpha-sialidase [Myxococcales bacterium]
MRSQHFMVRLHHVLVTALLAAGCYRPSAPSGSYECDASNLCPSNLQCICGMCVSGEDAAACSLTIAIDPSCPAGAGDSCVAVEGRPFKVNLAAFTRTGTPSKYSGPAVIGSSWGHARTPTRFTMSGGVANGIEVTLDRATPLNTAAVLNVRAGSGVGLSERSVLVDPPRLTVDPGPVLDTSAGWARAWIGHPAIDRSASGYTLYFAGVPGVFMDPHAKLGVATSSDGKQWNVAATPLFTSADNGHFFSPSVLRSAPDEVRLFFSHIPKNKDAAADVFMATSSDGGKTFGAAATVLSPLRCVATGCGGTGILYPWALLDPIGKGWLLYYTQFPNDMTGRTSTLALARSGDRGASWHLDPVPVPQSGALFSISVAESARVVYDAESDLYRMWYAQITDPTNPTAVCKTVIQYATSADGLFWTGTRGGAALSVADVPWAPAHNSQPPNPSGPVDGLAPGAIEPPDPATGKTGYTVWFSPTTSASGFCFPLSIGRASRP